jgi:hypothetical protein
MADEPPSGASAQVEAPENLSKRSIARAIRGVQGSQWRRSRRLIARCNSAPRRPCRDRPKRRYQRTARTITSGGKQKPAKADRAMGVGRRRRLLISTVCLLGSPIADATAPFDVAVGQAEAQVPADRNDDHVGWEAKAGEGGARRIDWRDG